jgi:hypothetical protein
MRLFRSARWLMLALLVCLIPATSFAGVFISVGFAPPVLPVYEQPPCPEPGWMWTPGYWAYGEDGYYWVPGSWVPAPYEGALWTPGYWGWSGGLYVFHDGYWGRHVGYYGGVNYGFGYGGIGFAGGMWRGHEFAYNTAVMRVDERRIHTVYMDRTIVERGYVSRDSHVAFSGGPGGIRHDPGPEERAAEHEQHVARTSFQQQHESAARSDRGSYFKSNGGRPQNLAVARPLGSESHGGSVGRPGSQGSPQGGMQQGGRNAGAGQMGQRPNSVPQTHSQPMQESRPAMQQRPTQQNPMQQTRPAQQTRPETQQRPAQQARPAQQSRPEAQQRPAPQSRPEAQQRPAPQSRPAPQARPAPQQRPAQQARPEPAPKNEHK